MPSLEDISVYTDLLPILVILLLAFRIKVLPIWVILLYCSYSFVNNQLLILRQEEIATNDVRLYLQFFTLFEYLAFATVLYLILKNKLAKNILILISFGFTIFCVYGIWNKEQFKSLDSLQISIESIIIVVFCLYFLAEQIIYPEIEFIYNSYKFWLAAALLIYLSGAFFVFTFAEDIKVRDERDNFWKLIYVCNIIRDLLFIIAIWKAVKATNTIKKIAF
jgi:hypothetical protein